MARWAKWADIPNRYWGDLASANNHRAKGRGRATGAQIRQRISLYEGICWVPGCGRVYQVIDHVIPLSKGGSGWPSNLRPSCWYHNRIKRNLSLREFVSRLPELEKKTPRERYQDYHPSCIKKELYPADLLVFIMYVARRSY